MKYLFGVILIAVNIGTANAAIYKCIGADKKTTYSEEPCSGKVEVLQIQDNVMSSEHLRVKSNELFNSNTGQPSSVTTTVDSPNLMSSTEINNRIKELEVDIKSMNSSPEKIGSSRRELSIMKRSPNKLSYELERERGNWRRLLNSQDISTRRKAFNELNSIFAHY